MITGEIQSVLEAIEQNKALYEETNFEDRAAALDTLEFNVIARLDGLPPSGELARLKEAAERVRRRLEGVDETLFQRLRAGIRRGDFTGAALKKLVETCVKGGSSVGQDGIGYDTLDLFINGLLLFRPVPAETKAREPEMVYYQPTPARIIFELVETAPLTREDVFYDIGSGLGQVPILVHLLGGAAAKGIEFEPAYCDYARAGAAGLNLSGVEFFNEDARAANYSAGTVFFMYTPFEGNMLQAVLDRLRAEAQKRSITLFTYGPCTPQVARQSWLKAAGPNGDQIYQLAEFRSL